MGSTSIQFDGWSLAWKTFRHKFIPECGSRDCRHGRLRWRTFFRRPQQIRLQAESYCMDECFDQALAAAIRRVQAPSLRPPAPHRIPLGLLLLSRRQVSQEQLRVALEHQRAAGRGRLGEWLDTLGFVTEQQVTAALARQWSCPVLRAVPPVPSDRIPRLPAALLEHFTMLPVDYIEGTRTLHIAFGDCLDYSLLYAIEQMLGCRTEPCMAAPSVVKEQLQRQPSRREDFEAVFDRVAGEEEFCRIVRSYAIRISAKSVRLVSCGPYLWARLSRFDGHPPVDLLLSI